MKAVTPPDTPTGLQPGRGGFLATSAGVRYIADPSGATVKLEGNKADLVAIANERGIDLPEKITVAQLHELLGGRPKRVPYSDTSNFGTLIENRGSLEKWSERKVIAGLALADFSDLFDQWRAETDGPARDDIADMIIARAKEQARSTLAADRGTHVHLLFETFDQGDTITHLLADGEALGIPAQVQADLVVAWRRLLADNGLEVLAVETAVVDDRWRCAGTLDRLVRVTRPLSFVVATGEIITVPAGVYVLDIKTGLLRRTAAIQIASYAQSSRYCTATETRSDWPWPIEQAHGLIAHVDIDACTIDLVHVDLDAGRSLGGECVVMAKRWERATPFSTAQHASGSGLQPVEPDAPTSVAPPVATGDAPAGSPVAAGAPSEGPGSAQPDPAPRTPADEQDAVRSRPAPDDGDPVVDPAYDVLEREYLALDAEGRAWITALTEQATRAGVSFHSRGHRTERRYSIIRGLVLLAANSATIDDDLVRALLEGVIGHVAQFQSVPVGQLVGSLTAREAHDFADLCDRFAAGQFGLTVDDDGAAHLRAAA